MTIPETNDPNRKVVFALNRTSYTGMCTISVDPSGVINVAMQNTG